MDRGFRKRPPGASGIAGALSRPGPSHNDPNKKTRTGGPVRVAVFSLAGGGGLALPPGQRPAQFFDLSTRAFSLIHGIMSRSLAPTSSIGWALLRARVAL